MATVKSILHLVKPTRYTFYNLDKKSIEDFKKLYSYLKKHETKNVLSASMLQAKDVLKQQAKYSDYVRKYKAMNLVSTAIVR